MIFANGRSRFEPRAPGTRFRLFPQNPVLAAYRAPETVWVSSPPGTIRSGPADDRMYVVDPIDKPRPYDDVYGPPYRGPAYPAVQPGPDGHFDHLDPGSREFIAAHAFGTIRFVLDVWEKYFDGEVPWHFAHEHERLEIVPLIEWNNAQCGWGFIETGFASLREGERQPFGLNFDVVAHEIGHALLYALLGTPPPDERVSAQYVSFHESAADCIAMIAVLHFDSVVDRLLERTRGNIYAPNELNRIGELSEIDQIRTASHSLTLADVHDLDTPLEALSQPDRHRMGQPLTGAVFDVLVEVFQEILVREGLIGRALDDASRLAPIDDQDAIQGRFDRAYVGRETEFKAALHDARDYTGNCLASAWSKLKWQLTFSDAAAALLTADYELTGGAGRSLILESLHWRGLQTPFRGVRRSYFQRVSR